MQEGIPSGHKIDYVVGAELGIKDLLGGENTLPLLSLVVKAGAAGAGIADNVGGLLWYAGDAALLEAGTSGADVKTFLHEGEAIGRLVVAWGQLPGPSSADLTDIIHACLSLIIRNTAKRMLTTELHTTVVHQSYAELLETNSRLQASEARYRELAGELEKKVEARTKELSLIHARMLQQEKLAAVGQLAAGVAHEINNPLGFISSNLNTLGGYVTRLLDLIAFYKATFDRLGLDRTKVEEYSRRLKLDFIMGDINGLLSQSREGAARVKKIVEDLKGFSHVDDAGETYVNLNDELDKTVGVLAHQSGDRVTYLRDYAGLPTLLCRPGLISQVFLNIILNAIQSTPQPVEVRLSTRAENNGIQVTIRDNGPGIPAAVLTRVCEPFFTTKEIGSAAGLGLSVAFDIMKQHSGEMTVSSPQGEGAVVTLWFPLRKERVQHKSCEEIREPNV